LVCLQDLGAEPALDAALGDIDEATMNRYPPLGIDGVLTEAAVQEHFCAALGLTTTQPEPEAARGATPRRY
jgi:hypothetical protein